MAKRKLELDNLEDITEHIPAASIHGVIQSLSPLKKGKQSSYYEGKLLVNEGNTQRFVGFKKNQQSKLQELMDQKKAVHLDDCEVKKSKRGNSMEIMLKSNTSILQSPKKFDSVHFNKQDEVIPLDLLQSKSLFDKVNVKIKVVKLMDPTTTSTGKKIQEAIIGDATATAKCTLWEASVGSLQPDSCYLLKQFNVQEFNSKKFLSIQKQGSNILHLEDIGLVADPEEEEPEEKLINTYIVGVPKLDCYKCCLRCKARVEPSDTTIGRCSKPDCGMLQRYDVCRQQLSANLLFMGNTQPVSLFANSSTLQSMAQGKITEEHLLQLPKFTEIKYKNGVITSFSY